MYDHPSQTTGPAHPAYYHGRPSSMYVRRYRVGSTRPRRTDRG